VLDFYCFVGGWTVLEMVLHHLGCELRTTCSTEVLTDTTWGDSSKQLHSLAEDINLSANGRHPTTYPLCFHLFFTFLLFIFSFFLFSSITFAFFFLGTKRTSIQVWGCGISHANPDNSPSPRSTLSMLFTHGRQCVI
jgi:hypothetical protein